MAARDDKVIIRITEDIKLQFQKQAEKRGMTMSSLGAYVIGDWVRGQLEGERIQDDAFRDTLSKFAPLLEKMMKDEESRA